MPKLSATPSCRRRRRRRSAPLRLAMARRLHWQHAVGFLLPIALTIWAAADLHQQTMSRCTAAYHTDCSQ